MNWKIMNWKTLCLIGGLTVSLAACGDSAGTNQAAPSVSPATTTQPSNAMKGGDAMKGDAMKGDAMKKETTPAKP